jgi:DNA-binding XRE family transcriptional regulator
MIVPGKLGGDPLNPFTTLDNQKMNTKRVRELSGLTQQQIAHALDLTLNGWQRKEQYHRDIKVELKITERMMAELLKRAHTNKTTVSELVREMIEKDTPPR